MKILYDHQIFAAQNYGGISRYFTNLMDQFDREKVEYELPSMFTNNHYIKTLNKTNSGEFKVISIKNKYIRRISKRFTNYYNKNDSRKLLKKADFDVFHPTYYDPYFLRDLKDKPFVVTVHDLIQEIFPEYFGMDDQIISWKRELIEKADRIIAVSKNTKNDIARFYDVESDKVQVIYHGNSMSLDRTPGKLPGSFPVRYVLFVGDRSLYKNFFLFAEGMALLMKSDPDLYLLCVGGGPFTRKERIFLKNLENGNRIYHYMVNDSELSALYRHALAFAYPSLYEGFGIPVLEAFASECPAILSNTSSLPEVGGEAAIYFDPRDLLSIKNAISSVIDDEELREKLKTRGKDRLKIFSWEKCAQETLSVYNSLI